MRIGIVCPYSFDEPGGVQAHILDLARYFLADGHYVRVIGPCSKETAVPDYVVRGGSAIAIPYNGSVARLSINPIIISRVKNFIREGNFDVLHIHEPSSPSYSLVALIVAQGPIVATYHMANDSSRMLHLASPLLTPFLEKIGGGIAVSELARRWQVEQLGGDPVLIPNGVDTKQFRQALEEVPPRTDDRPRIAFLGRLDEPRKGLDILLSALEELHRPFICTVMGAGKPRPHAGVEFVGRVSDEEKARILAESDIYVAPNTGGESFGIVLVEAMAARCAVVATNLEAFADVLNVSSAQPAGVLFPRGDSSALAAVLRTLIDNPSMRESYARAGEERAASFDWSVVARKIMRVYEIVRGGSDQKVTVR